MTKRDAYDIATERAGQFWAHSGAAATSILFWMVALLLLCAAASTTSLDLFIKAFGAVATAGVALALWQTTRTFHRASEQTAEKKLRLDLFEQRLPIWEKFKRIRATIINTGSLSPTEATELTDLSRDAKLMFPDGPLVAKLHRYSELAHRLQPSGYRPQLRTSHRSKRVPPGTGFDSVATARSGDW